MQTVSTCVLYARLSVTKEESVSIARQLRSCRGYAEARGWEVTGEFIDDGVSATANRPEDRKGWSALMATEGFDSISSTPTRHFSVGVRAWWRSMIPST